MIVWVSWRCSRDGQILALRAALGGQRVAAFPGELAVGEGHLSGLSERDEAVAAESEGAGPAADEPLHPAAGAGGVDVEVQAVAVAVPAGGVGIGLAVWLLDLLATADLPLPIPVALDLGLDRNVLAFTFGVSVVAGALLGLVPALQGTRTTSSGSTARCPRGRPIPSAGSLNDSELVGSVASRWCARCDRSSRWTPEMPCATSVSSTRRTAASGSS